MNISFTIAWSCQWITLRVHTATRWKSTSCVAFTFWASFKVICTERMVSRFALITSFTSNACLAMAFSSFQSFIRMSFSVTNSSIDSSVGVAVTWNTHIWISKIFRLVMIEPFATVFTMDTLSIMLAVITNTTAHMIGCFPNCFVKVAFVWMIMAITS